MFKSRQFNLPYTCSISFDSMEQNVRMAFETPQEACETVAASIHQIIQIYDKTGLADIQYQKVAEATKPNAPESVLKPMVTILGNTLPEKKIAKSTLASVSFVLGRVNYHVMIERKKKYSPKTNNQINIEVCYAIPSDKLIDSQFCGNSLFKCDINMQKTATFSDTAETISELRRLDYALFNSDGKRLPDSATFEFNGETLTVPVVSETTITTRLNNVKLTVRADESKIRTEYIREFDKAVSNIPKGAESRRKDFPGWDSIDVTIS